MERAKKEIPEEIFTPGKREKKRVVSLGRVFVGFTVRDERAITVSRDPQTNNYYVDVDGINNYVGKTVPEWARLRVDENTICNPGEFVRIGW